MDSTSGEDSHQFLQGIERRHDDLLDQLEQLNGQIEQVLGDYLSNRDKTELTNSDSGHSLGRDT